ncbi:mandelate racemase/muconate lactonizing enzyme family protein [Flagellimonas meridianipacifica]|uniref:Galactonate dehydratase n=1 Tax=Flagellimonas meridianipacifica TaxID=1080225 RepID=A0A2T0M8G8_9FLAO|nr:mandelate racemase/muconate lactonizing enzyme family protein [Allomuricauda pacifica]PRX53836.1 galactonate dehydratase [Allomuricauda pacifica]
MKRRKFLGSTSLASAFALLGPEKMTAALKTWDNLATIEDSFGLKITKITPIVVPYASYVKVETNAGITGWGESDKDFRPLGKIFLEEVVIKHLIGKNPMSIDSIWNYMYFKSYDEGGYGLVAGALAGIDNALWDIKGKALGVPVSDIIGGRFRDKVKCYGSFGANVYSHEKKKYEGRKKKTPLEMAKIASGFAELGYTAIKVRMQIRQLNIDPNPDPSFDTVKEVRAAVGDDMTIFFDANNGYTPHRAIEVGKKLRELYNIATIEEPVTMNNYHALNEVSTALDFPITAGEHEYTRWQFRDLIQIGHVDIINPDLLKSGGMSECLKIAQMASAFDKRFMIHSAYPMIGTSAGLQFAASQPNAMEYQEYVGPRPWMGLQKYFKNDLEFQNGYLNLPTGPGWGLEMDEKILLKDALN